MNKLSQELIITLIYRLACISQLIKEGNEGMAIKEINNLMYEIEANKITPF